MNRQHRYPRPGHPHAQDTGIIGSSGPHTRRPTRTALGKQGAAVAQRKRAGGASPKTRAELYEIARKRDLPGRSKMGRDELARKLSES